MNQVVFAKTLEEYIKLLNDEYRYIEYPYSIRAEVYHYLSNNWEQFKNNKYFMYEYGKILISSAEYLAKEKGKKIMVDLTKENDQEAWNLLGEYYEENINFYDKCFMCYMNAAFRNSAKAMVNIGLLYLYGRYLPQNTEMAILWFEQAAKKGYGKAFSILGNMYKDGNGVEADSEKAQYWYKKGAEIEDAESLYHLVNLLYESYDNVTNDDEEKEVTAQNNKLIPYVQKSAELGYVPAMCLLDTLSIRDFKSTEWLIKAAELGDVEAQTSVIFDCFLGLIEVENDDMKVYWLKKAAENDYGPAQTILGSLYLAGRHVPKDIDMGIYWYENSVRNGQYSSLVSLGNIYYSLKDYSRAFRYFKWAASRKDPIGLNYLGTCYMQGVGVKVNEKKGFKIIKEAAELGEYTSQLLLAVFYFNGEIVKFDITKAIYWRDKALFNLENNEEKEKKVVDAIKEYCENNNLCASCGKIITGRRYKNWLGPMCEECHDKKKD